VAVARSTRRQASFYLLEQFIPGSVYHVDSVVSEREVVFAEAHVYGAPRSMFASGGVFTTSTLPYGSDDTNSLLAANRR